MPVGGILWRTPFAVLGVELALASFVGNVYSDFTFASSASG